MTSFVSQVKAGLKVLDTNLRFAAGFAENETAAMA